MTFEHYLAEWYDFVAPCCLPSGLVGRHIAQAQLMHLCLNAVKTSMLVLQRSQEAASAALQAAEGSCGLQSTLSSLLDRYVDILTNGMCVERNRTLFITLFIKATSKSINFK